MFTLALIIHFRFKNKPIDTQNDKKTPQSIDEKKEIIKEKVYKYKRTLNFWAHFLLNLYLTSVPIFFNFNIKVIGLRYFTDEQVNIISYCQTGALLVSTIGCGICLDKFGSKRSLMTIFSVLTLSLVVYLNFRSTFWVFLCCNTIFFVIHGSADTFKGACLQSIYNPDIAVNLQPLFQMSKPLAAVLTFMMDNYVHTRYGADTLFKVYIGLNIICLVSIKLLNWKVS